jgi:hypothetical protein
LKRASFFAFAIPASAALFAWAGCALVIDLGDEARLQPSDAASGTAADTGAVVDSGPGPTPLLCGMPRANNEACSTCTEGNCCAENEACAADPDCVAGLQCVQDCMAQYACVDACGRVDGGPQNAHLAAVVNCSTGKCFAQCVPLAKCQALGACASKLDPEKDKLLRDLAKGLILLTNEDNCEAERLQLGKDHDIPECK